jgi:hypothetical protein
VAQAFGCSSTQCGIPVRPKKLHRKEIKLTPKKVIKTEFHRNNFGDNFFEELVYGRVFGIYLMVLPRQFQRQFLSDGHP